MDYQALLNEWIALYEAATGEMLQPASRERLLIDIAVSRELLVRQRIQGAAEQNLQAYAGYPMIDHLGELLGAPRLAAAAATVPLEFSLIGGAQAVDCVIPQGTRARSKDRRATFATVADATIAAGATVARVSALCTRPGVAGNGYAAGQIVELVDQLDYSLAVSNVEQSANGRASEETEAYRLRQPLVQRGRSVAGPSAAYERLARSARADIVDVDVSNPAGGVVRITVLTEAGVADAGVLDQVYEVCSPETARPITDSVEVVSAAPVAYSVVAVATLRRAAFADASPALFASWAATLTARAQAYADSLRTRLGADVVLAQIHRAVMSDEVYDLAVMVPGATVPVGRTEFAQATEVVVTVSGFDEEVEP